MLGITAAHSSIVAQALTTCKQTTWGLYGDFPKFGVPFLGGPNNEDYSILGSTLGSPDFRKLPYRVRVKGLGFRV